MTKDKALTMALEALEEATTYTSSASFSPSMTRDCEKAIAAIKAVLAQPAAQAEPNEADQLLTALRLDPDTYRTDGGWLNIPKIMAAIASPADYPYTTGRAMSESIDQKVTRLMVLVNEQAEDETLWCKAHTIVESMLQEALRRLHAAIESTPQPDPYITELIDRLRDKTDVIPDMTVRQANAHLVCLCNDAADALEAAHDIKGGQP